MTFTTRPTELPNGHTELVDPSGRCVGCFYEEDGAWCCYIYVGGGGPYASLQDVPVALMDAASTTHATRDGLLGSLCGATNLSGADAGVR